MNRPHPRLASCLVALVLVITALTPMVSLAQDTDDEPTGTPVATPLLAPEVTPGPSASPVLPGTATPAASPTVSAGPAPRSHDWRSEGFASVVGGELFDPFCRPLRSVGSNVPNLMFRQGLRENLTWMHQHRMRWMRVIATGHGQLIRSPEAVPGVVEQRLAELLREVEAFNAARPPAEAIYVLVSFTDYYEPGVPGDQYGFDHPSWCSARVLNAPWYRRGVQRYAFDQECGGGRLVDAPNYEVHFKPWVERLVAVGARSPALLGWQLGNEMKARDSRRNRIEDAYGWYVDWTADMTDAIRRIDKNHLIFAGAQYLAELTDWPYRPHETEPDPGLVEPYSGLFERIIAGCKTYCWNVWSLTSYDFGLYSVDDAQYLRVRGIAAVMTEYGFTLGSSPEEERARFGGDRVRAHREGRARPWLDLGGERHARDWGAFELIERGGLQGIAPWGSPAPDADAYPYLDLDSERGISLVGDGDGLWQFWQEAGGRLEAENDRRGVSPACAALISE